MPGRPARAKPRASKKFDVAAASAFAPHRHRGFAARQQHAEARKRPSAIGDVAGDPGHRLADTARLAFDRVAEHMSRQTSAPGDRRRLERQFGRRDQPHFTASEARIIGLDALASAALQQLVHRLRRGDL